MNAVLARDQRLIERGRHTAGNLAHALKTPLSVMRLQLRQLPEANRAAWEVELERVDSAVRHHLARASAADNALRWAHSDVQLQLESDGQQLTLTVSDDGPGMNEAECQQAVQRGKRLDEQRSGSGLGLAIVTDLVALYSGQLHLSRASAGGLKVEVELPVVACNRRA